MDNNVTFKEQEAQSLSSYLDAQDVKFDLIKDFVVEGYTVDDELLSTMRVFQDRGLEVYQRYMEAQKNLETKLQSINIINDVVKIDNTLGEIKAIEKKNV